MVVFRQAWVPHTPPARFISRMHINEVWALCLGAQGALWGPGMAWILCWGVNCQASAKTVHLLTARLTGLGDPGPLNLPCDTLIVGFQSMLLVYKMQGRGRWRALLTVGLNVLGGAASATHTTPHRLPPLPKHLAATIAILICSQIMLYAGCWMDGWHHRPTTSEPRHVGPCPPSPAWP
jgi:hypothetical protein